MIHCYNMKCKYCNDKYKCINKNVELNFVGINTKYQGFKELLECESFEESELYKNTMELLKKVEPYDEWKKKKLREITEEYKDR